jgi:hypothetical protein
MQFILFTAVIVPEIFFASLFTPYYTRNFEKMMIPWLGGGGVCFFTVTKKTKLDGVYLVVELYQIDDNNFHYLVIVVILEI